VYQHCNIVPYACRLATVPFVVQAVAYFLDPTRMANPSYINRFIDILRSSLGRPLLNQLAASSEQLKALIHLPGADQAEDSKEVSSQVSTL
jgi:hypothetical protein